MPVNPLPTTPMPEDEQCPVCGYYCLGHGGAGCIDKPSMLQTSPSPEGREDHWPCHDIVCNGDKRFPRNTAGVGCSCGTRHGRLFEELTELRASLTEAQAERDAAQAQAADMQQFANEQEQRAIRAEAEIEQLKADFNKMAKELLVSRPFLTYAQKIEIRRLLDGAQ